MKAPRQTLQADRHETGTTLKDLAQDYNHGYADVEDLDLPLLTGRNFGTRFKKRPSKNYRVR